MLKDPQIAKIASAVAKTTLKPKNVIRVMSEPMVDSKGEDALRITIVIEPDAVDRITGDAVLNTLVQIQDRLREAGEERFPIVEYATEEDLASVDD